jgi:hypothetical protein
MADINLGVGGANSATGGYEIDNSLKFEADNTEIIYRTNNSGTNRKTFTVSLWFKRTELGADQEVWHGGRNGQTTVMGILSYSSADDNLWVDVGGGTGNTSTLYRSFSTQKIRDTSAWYHFVLAVDTTQATEANRMKVWLNGEEVTDWAQHQIPAQDFQCALESGTEMAWGGFRPNNSEIFSGYIAEGHYLDGVAKVQTDFGEYDEDSGIWKPKAYTGSYGGNGCYMKFDDSSDLGADSSGNSNDFTLNNITSADQATDTPTNNFCTLNPIFTVSSGVGDLTISEGGTRTVNTASAYKFATSTIGVSSGKWYWEVNGTYVRTISLAGVTMPYYWLNGNIAFSGTVYYAQSGQRYNNSSASSFGPGWGDGDIIAFALDMDASTPTLNVYKNNTSLGDLFSGLSLTGSGATFLPPKEDGYFAKLVNYSTNTFDINFGGYTAASISSAASDENGYGTFEYAPPSGYYAICTKNLAEYG